MSVFDRLRRPFEPVAGNVSHKRVAELSDDELEAELLRRRRQRAGVRSNLGPIAGTSERDSPEQKQLLQYYANLELPPFASIEEVKRAYKDLVRRYHPDKHAGDPERQKVASELTQSLTRAYEALTRYLEAR